jgi:xylulokinase
VEIVEAEEGAAYGAALLAGVGGGVWRTVEDACDAVVRVATTVKPNEKVRATLAKQYKSFRAIYPALRAIQL